MKNKIYRSIALLFVAVLSTAAVIAQPGRDRDDNNRRYDDRNDNYHDRHYNDRDDDRHDRDGRYDRSGYDKRDYRQYQIRHRPSEPRYIQSRRSSPNHIWVPGDWVFNRGQYSYQQGYWAMPSGGQVYVPGRWERVHRGWYWVPGYWTRVSRRW